MEFLDYIKKYHKPYINKKLIDYNVYDEDNKNYYDYMIKYCSVKKDIYNNQNNLHENIKLLMLTDNYMNSNCVSLNLYCIYKCISFFNFKYINLNVYKNNEIISLIYDKYINLSIYSTVRKCEFYQINDFSSKSIIINCPYNLLLTFLKYRNIVFHKCNSLYLTNNDIQLIKEFYPKLKILIINGKHFI